MVWVLRTHLSLPTRFASLAADKAGKYVPQQQRHANERRVSYSKDEVMRPALYYEQTEESWPEHDADAIIFVSDEEKFNIAILTILLPLVEWLGPRESALQSGQKWLFRHRMG